MDYFTIVEVKNGPEISKAIYGNDLPVDDNTVHELVQILAGNDPCSQIALCPVTNEKSVPALASAQHTMILAFTNMLEDGIYGIIEWVCTILDPAMPKGWGAALTQPTFFDSVLISSKEPIYLIVLSPMDRSKTSPIPHFMMGDPHCDECPTLIPMA